MELLTFFSYHFKIWASVHTPSAESLYLSFSEGGIPGVAKTAEEYHAFLDRLVIELKILGYTPKIKWILGRKPGVENVS